MRPVCNIYSEHTVPQIGCRFVCNPAKGTHIQQSIRLILNTCLCGYMFSSEATSCANLSFNSKSVHMHVVECGSCGGMVQPPSVTMKCFGSESKNWHHRLTQETGMLLVLHLFSQVSLKEICHLTKQTCFFLFHVVDQLAALPGVLFAIFPSLSHFPKQSLKCYS